MNAVIALCHFCEQHGPSILFSTQPFHCTNHTREEVEKGDVIASPSACGISHTRLQYYSDSPESPTKANVTRKFSGSRSTCEACRSLEAGEPGLISISQESHINYISTQHPEEQELFRVLRNSCVRSLSCEVCPGREGPIMFGDEGSGYVFSYTFFLKDKESRGFQRWYSIICAMMDRIYLVNSWPFLVSNFKSIIDDLQAKADKFYQSEVAEKAERDSKLQSNSTYMPPNQFRRGRYGHTYRSLRHILNDKNVFVHLHERFTWVLQASGQRYTEKLLEGAPLADYLNEDSNNETDLLDDLTINADEGNEGAVFLSLSHVFKVFGSDDFRQIAFHVVRGDQVIVQCDYKRTVASLLTVLKELVPAGCFRCLPYEETYQDSWKCNFLGLPLKSKIPKHLLESPLYVKISIEKKQVESATSSSLKYEAYDSFEEFDLKVKGSPVEREPSYLKSIMESLEETDVNEEMFTIMLVALKERWMGKVKMMFKFSRSPGRTTEDKDRLLQILKAKSDDEILLKYWMTSFSRSYRSHLLSPEKNAT